jgi:uncharacterized phage-associated protein
MIRTYYREKLINAIVYFASHTQKCGMTKLMKLLFFLDFAHFKQTGKSVTGMEYFAWKRGPVPQVLWFELTKEMKPDMASAVGIIPCDNFKKIIAKDKFNSDFFTKREMKLLQDIAEIFYDTAADLTVEVAHLPNEPWHRTLMEKGEKKRIDFLLAVDDKPGSLTYAEAKQRMEEIADTYNALGVE